MKKKGAALLVVIIIMMLTFLLATIMIETSIKHLRVSSDTVEGTKSYYSAETGVYDAINYIELMAATGSFNTTYYAYDIPINNLYSSGENSSSGNNYLFGDSSATYTASIRLNSIVNPTSKDITIRQYTCTIYSKGTYNNQNYLINDTVTIYYNNGSWTYSYTSKLSTKD
jgi:Tfp pilus assembly protein PilX